MILTSPADVAPLVPIIPPAFDRGHCLAVAAGAIVPLPNARRPWADARIDLGVRMS